MQHQTPQVFCGIISEWLAFLRYLYYNPKILFFFLIFEYRYQKTIMSSSIGNLIHNSRHYDLANQTEARILLPPVNYIMIRGKLSLL